jgi:predicted transcriptional regulator
MLLGAIMPDNQLQSSVQSTNGVSEFLELLGNKYIDEILSLTSMKECSALELSKELNIPLATVYRKLKLLENSEMIENVKTTINLSGNEEKYYRCLVNEATVSFHDGKFSIDLKRMDHINKILRVWRRFSKTK